MALGPVVSFEKPKGVDLIFHRLPHWQTDVEMQVEARASPPGTGRQGMGQLRAHGLNETEQGRCVVCEMESRTFVFMISYLLQSLRVRLLALAFYWGSAPSSCAQVSACAPSPARPHGALRARRSSRFRPRNAGRPSRGDSLTVQICIL